MTDRVQLALNVNDIDQASSAFYAKLFGTGPKPSAAPVMPTSPSPTRR